MEVVGAVRLSRHTANWQPGPQILRAKRYSEPEGPSWGFKCQGCPQSQPGYQCKGTTNCLRRKVSKGRDVLRHAITVCSRTLPESEWMHACVYERVCLHACVCECMYMHVCVCLSFSVSRPDLPDLPGDFYVKSMFSRRPHHKTPLRAWLFSNTPMKPKC